MKAGGLHIASGPEVWRQARQGVIEHYEEVLRQYGPTARGMEWKDEASQRLRFSVLAEVCDLNGATIHEIGAGAGHFCDYLRHNAIRAEYSGSDVSPAMVEAARRLHPGVRFEPRDIILEPPAETYDIVLSSGVLNVKLEHTDAEWCTYVREVIRGMYRMCRVAIAFNLMTDFVEFRKDILYYDNAGEMLDFCRRELSRSVVLRHDYPLYEYTIYVYRRCSVEARKDFPHDDSRRS